jgi:hypothetical protein
MNSYVLFNKLNQIKIIKKIKKIKNFKQLILKVDFQIILFTNYIIVWSFNVIFIKDKN